MLDRFRSSPIPLVVLILTEQDQDPFSSCHLVGPHLAYSSASLFDYGLYGAVTVPNIGLWTAARAINQALVVLRRWGISLFSAPQKAHGQKPGALCFRGLWFHFI